MAFDASGALHVSSRFDGSVYKVLADGSTEIVVRELGVACGIAFGSDGTMFVGDRSGTIFRVGSSTRWRPSRPCRRAWRRSTWRWGRTIPCS